MIMNRLEELRKSKRLNQKQLAQIVGTGQSSISHWENGKYDIDNASLAKLADYFNCTIDYLLGRTDSPTVVHITTREEVEAAQKIAQQKSSPLGSGEEAEKDFERIMQAYAKATPEQRAEFAKIFERYVDGED